MLANALAVDVRSDDVLNPLPGGLIDEHLVTPVVVNALKLGLTLVVRIDENFM